jgi:hypothetical protein
MTAIAFSTPLEALAGGKSRTIELLAEYYPDGVDYYHNKFRLETAADLNGKPAVVLAAGTAVSLTAQISRATLAIRRTSCQSRLQYPQSERGRSGYSPSS